MTLEQKMYEIYKAYVARFYSVQPASFEDWLQEIEHSSLFAPPWNNRRTDSYIGQYIQACQTLILDAPLIERLTSPIKWIRDMAKETK